MELKHRTKSTKRKRGVTLSTQGWQRLQAAEYLACQGDNGGKPYTLEQLAALTNISPNTLTKVRRRQRPVDLPTLETYFRGFRLTLSPDDYLGHDAEETTPTQICNHLKMAPLKGCLAVDSPFYIPRPPLERLCLDEVLTAGALIRIKGPHGYGKTSLMAQVISRSQEQNMKAVVISLRGADRWVFENSDHFLRWFCAMVARGLGLPDGISDRWDNRLGASYAYWHYLHDYLLPSAGQPLLVAIDDMDILLSHPHVAMDFLGLLRAWYEGQQDNRAAHSSQLRLMMVYTALALYCPLVSQVPLQMPLHVPFNIGLMVTLKGFSRSQVQGLVQRYGLEESETVAQHLYQFLGGHPYLTQRALYHLNRDHGSLATLPQDGLAHDGIFCHYLQQHLGYLQQQPALAVAMAQVVSNPDGVVLEPHTAFTLEALGLINFVGQQAVPSCELYQKYFATALSPIHS